MTDLEKWEKFLSEQHIVYKLVTAYDHDIHQYAYRRQVLMIDYNGERKDEKLYQEWKYADSDTSLYVVFNVAGEFVRFDFGGVYRLGEYIKYTGWCGVDW